MCGVIMNSYSETRRLSYSASTRAARFRRFKTTGREVMKHLVIAILMMAILPVQAAIQGSEVDYHADGTTLKGYLAYDDSIKGRRPGVLVVHEWWGHNEYARKRATMLAELGYVALAVDMYGDGRQAMHPKEAQEFSSEIASNIKLSKARFLAALQVLKNSAHVDKSRIAAIGYCFGGGVALQMAREGIDLNGVVSFHGDLTTKSPAGPGAVKARILVATGGADPFVPPDRVADFIKEMNNAGADYRVIVYSGAMHSFTNPMADQFGKKFNLPLQYNKQADQASWAAMQRFFENIFK